MKKKNRGWVFFVLALILLDIVPVAALAAPPPVFNIYASSVSAPDGIVEAQPLAADSDKDGQEFILTLVGVTLGDDFFMESSRASADTFYYGLPGTTDAFAPEALVESGTTGAFRIPEAAFEHITGSTYFVKIKAISTSGGRSHIVFGICAACVVDCARNRTIPFNEDPAHAEHTISSVIIGGQPFPVDFYPISDRATLSLGFLAGEAGEFVRIPLKITDNAGFSSFICRVSYDKTKLEPTVVEPGSAWVGDFFYEILADYLLSDHSILISGASPINTEADGVIAWVTFTIKEDTAPSASALSLDVHKFNGVYGVYNIEHHEHYSVEPGLVQVVTQMGDVDGDDQVTMTDVTWSYQHFRGKGELTLQQQLAMDVNKDGIVNLQDVLLSYQYFRKIITGFQLD